MDAADVMFACARLVVCPWCFRQHVLQNILHECPENTEEGYIENISLSHSREKTWIGDLLDYQICHYGGHWFVGARDDWEPEDLP